ncbi:MAG TPA: hypothetical protein VGK74_10785 [Symbiobacteriaceae bacterium]|jgi:hypothetical protein
MVKKRLYSVLSLVLLLAVALFGPTPHETLAAPPEDVSVGPPTTVAPVAPHVFAGDVRRIPATRPIKSDERQKPGEPAEPQLPAAKDTTIQAGATAVAAPAPSASFYGLDFANWGAGWPPDTNGDVGPTYYIQTVNTSIGIFDKSTGTRVAAFTFNTLFAQAGTGTPCDNANQGDPVVLYDPQTDRWVISDFAWAGANFATGPFYQCMAVSRSGDPVSGGWYFYAFKTNAGAFLPDYPKLGVWPDGIYMTANVFASSGSGAFQYAQTWAFNKADMYAGLPARSVTFQLPKAIKGVTVFSLLPSNMRTATGTPPAGAPNYLASIWGQYAVRLWQFHVDWNNTANSTLTGPTQIAVSTFSVPASTIPAKSGNALDSLGYRLMMQNQYTNLAGTQSIWLTHTVGNGSGIASIRWYQLNVGTSTITQQGTFNPDSNHRFIPSLAVDKLGNMAVGYSVSSSTMYPAIRYAGRLVTDPLGTLAQGETSLIEGTASQVGTFSDGSLNNRWGDYSAMTIAPDGCTFWYTTEYYELPQPTKLSEDNWKTRIGSFKYPGCQ